MLVPLFRRNQTHDAGPATGDDPDVTPGRADTESVATLPETAPAAHATAPAPPAAGPAAGGPSDPDLHLPALDRYGADVLRRLVETVLEERGEAGMSMVGIDYYIDASGARHSLDELSRTCATLAMPAWKAVIADHLAADSTPVTPDALDDEEFRARLRVRVAHRDDVPPAVADLAPDFLLPDTVQVLVLHAPGLLHTVTPEELAPHGSYAEMLAVAAAHTAAMVEHVQGITVPQEGADRVTVAVGPEHFTASMVTVLPQLVQHASDEFDVGHGIFVAVPTRAKVLYRVVDGPDAIGSLVRLYQQTHQSFEREPGPVSPHVFWVHQGQWRQATGLDATGAPTILLRDELEQEFKRAGWA